MCWWAVFFFAGILYQPDPVQLFLLVSILLFTLISLDFRFRRPPGSCTNDQGRRFLEVRAVLICLTGLLVMVSADPSGSMKRDGKAYERGEKVSGEDGEQTDDSGSEDSGGSRLRPTFISIALRDWLESRTEDHTLSPRSRALIKALILAQRETLDREVVDGYAYLGTAHFLALSGLHLGIISLALSGAIRFSLGSGSMAEMILLAVLAIYTSAAGSPPSLVRALALLIAYRVSAMMGVRLSLGHALLAGSFVLLSLRPGLLLSIGFQLSFLAVAGIAYLGLPAIELIRKRLSPGRVTAAFISTVTITISVQLMTAPLCLERFGRVPLLAASSNILMAVPVTLMLYLAMAHIAVPFQWARELVSIPLNMVSGILWGIPGKIMFLGGPCILRGEIEYLPYMLSIGLIALSLDMRVIGKKWIITGSLVLFVLSFILADGCRNRGIRGIEGDAGDVSMTILEGNPVILIVPARLSRYEAFRAVKRFWDEGHRKAGYLIVRSSDERELGGIGYLIERTGGPELVCSPYLRPPGGLGEEGEGHGYADGSTALQKNEGSGFTVIENDNYSVVITVPWYPPPRGSIVNIDEAALGYVVRRK